MRFSNPPQNFTRGRYLGSYLFFCSRISTFISTYVLIFLPICTNFLLPYVLIFKIFKTHFNFLNSQNLWILFGAAGGNFFVLEYLFSYSSRISHSKYQNTLCFLITHLFEQDSLKMSWSGWQKLPLFWFFKFISTY